MRLLVDNALSPRLAMILRDNGHDVVHVRDIGSQAAPENENFEVAGGDDRVAVSEDTDFGTLLSLRDSAKPSVILSRYMPDRTASALARLLLENFATVETDLVSGAIVVLEPGRIRIRRLPVGRSGS